MNYDGGSRGNPGHAGIGFLIAPRITIGEYIGIATNNRAEYTAVLEALKCIRQNLEPGAEVNCFLESQLVVEQLNGNYKLKNEGLKPLFWQVRELILALGGLTGTISGAGTFELKDSDGAKHGGGLSDRRPPVPTTHLTSF